MKDLETEYHKLLADKISVIIDDLSTTERTLIREAFILFTDKLRDIKTLEDEVYRLGIELANTKAMLDNRDDENEEFMDGGGYCHACGREIDDY